MAGANSGAARDACFTMLKASGRFSGGSPIGAGECADTGGQAKSSMRTATAPDRADSRCGQRFSST